MLNFAGKVFKRCFDVILWVFLAGSIIAGIVIGNGMGSPYESRVGYVVAGIIIGGVIGLLFVIVCGGIISNFLNMVDNIEKIFKNENINTIYDYETINEVNLRSEQNENSYVIKKLEKGCKLKFISQGEIYKYESVEAPWFRVKDENGNIGWCFSGKLNKI